MKQIVTGVALSVVALPLAIILLLGGGAQCGGNGNGPAPSAAAANGIPANYLQLYMAAGRKYGVQWNLLAGVGFIETDHGRSNQPGVKSGANSAGASGPMQFLEGTWQGYGVDGNHDGRKNKYDPRDAIPGAAKLLKASGAPGDLHSALFAYNHSEAYVASVLAKMREYGASGGTTASSGRSASSQTATTALTDTAGVSPATDAGAAGDCADGGGLTGTGNGKFKIAPGANLPGKSLTAVMTAFITRMATFYDGTLVVTTGTNHDQYTTSNNVSDHFTGNGADFGMVANHGADDGPVGDRIAASAFMAAGLPRDEAIKHGQAGGAQTLVTNGLRVQIIWKSDVGGNHHNHVHVGVKKISE